MKLHQTKYSKQHNHYTLNSINRSFHPEDGQFTNLVQLQKCIGNYKFRELINTMAIGDMLANSRVGNEYEVEANNVSDLVMQGRPEIKNLNVNNINPVKSSSSKLIGRFNSKKGPGRKFEPQVRSFMEHRFGRDFRDVNIHDDGFASRTNRYFRSKAYTIGNDIFFDPASYKPDTYQGKRMIAHELTHVIQSKGDNSSIAFWGSGGHSRITREAGNEEGLDGFFVFQLEAPSTLMDFRAAALTYNAIVLSTGIAWPVDEAANHGEGGLYTSTDRSASASINIARQNLYLRRAIARQREFNDLQSYGASVRELGNKAGEIYEQLGHALHVAQDRGSHGEGLRGEGHDQSDYDNDDISENPSGYAKAKRNSREVLSSFKRARGY